jgi:hypothetical protein
MRMNKVADDGYTLCGLPYRFCNERCVVSDNQCRTAQLARVANLGWTKKLSSEQPNAMEVITRIFEKAAAMH